MRHVSIFLLMLSTFFLPRQIEAQCASNVNIYTFFYDDTEYQIVKENQSWANASACAVEFGGYLAQIDSQAEQDAIFDNLMNYAGIVIGNTVAPDGGGASYVWIGGNDIANEGIWIWDGDNDGNGDQFWQGTASGNPVGGLFNNWGNEPDNWNNQDGLGLALTEWPLGSGTLGVAGQWNDVDDSNTLYYVIECCLASSVNDFNFQKDISIYPNPVSNTITIEIKGETKIESIKLHNELGQVILENYAIKKSLSSINVSHITSGLYYVIIENNNGKLARGSIMIK